MMKAADVVAKAVDAAMRADFWPMSAEARSRMLDMLGEQRWMVGWPPRERGPGNDLANGLDTNMLITGNSEGMIIKEYIEHWKE